jgi:hypothetical protein
LVLVEEWAEVLILPVLVLQLEIMEEQVGVVGFIVFEVYYQLSRLRVPLLLALVALWVTIILVMLLLLLMAVMEDIHRLTPTRVKPPVEKVVSELEQMM